MSPTILLWCLLSASDGGTTAASPELQSAMRLGFAAMARLQPYVLSPAAFRDPGHLQALKADLDVLARMEHQFQKGKKGPAADAIARLFDQQVGKARFELNAGNFEASRMRLDGLAGMCLGCHQRQHADRDFDDAAKLVDALDLDAMQRAAFYAATRQFDRALKAWQDALAKAPADDVEAMDQVRAVRSALAVAVRAKDDPKIALALLNTATGRGEFPGFVRPSLAHWLVDAKAWDKERLTASAMTPQQAFDRAKGLLTASKALDSVVVDDNFLISHLRAAAYLHQAVAQQKDAPWRTEALYLLGIATAAISEPALWELDGVYLEACVREAPHTAIARKCVQRLAERMTLAFTTQKGLERPAELGQKLGELRVLAR